VTLKKNKKEAKYDNNTKSGWQTSRLEIKIEESRCQTNR
jgi:hypothetical protein